ncbi:MAG: nuclease-related domain-containing protein [Solirubrobacteraceae bacterium]
MLRAVLASYPRRQQIRRLARAARFAGGSAIASAGAVALASVDQTALALCLGLVAVAVGRLSRRALRLAERSRVGAESEAQVRRALKPLAAEGWRIRHAVDWPGRGDLDHVVRSPSGMGFVIETKTLRYSHAHLARTIDATRWLARRRRHYPRGVVPVVCVARARSLERPVGTLLIVSLDRLLPALRTAAAAESVARRSTGGRPERSALQSGAPWESRTVGRAKSVAVEPSVQS